LSIGACVPFVFMIVICEDKYLYIFLVKEMIPSVINNVDSK